MEWAGNLNLCTVRASIFRCRRYSTRTEVQTFNAPTFQNDLCCLLTRTEATGRHPKATRVANNLLGSHLDKPGLKERQRKTRSVPFNPAREGTYPQTPTSFYAAPLDRPSHRVPPQPPNGSGQCSAKKASIAPTELTLPRAIRTGVVCKTKRRPVGGSPSVLPFRPIYLYPRLAWIWPCVSLSYGFASRPPPRLLSRYNCPQACAVRCPRTDRQAGLSSSSPHVTVETAGIAIVPSLSWP